jgi:DNA-binding response OmpR family regulator
MLPRSNAPRVLVVEDDPFEQQLILENLREFTEHVECADCAEAALQSIARELPDVILLDLILPGMSGQEFLAELHSRGWMEQLATIVISGIGDSSTVAQCLEIGADDHLTKPFSRPVLFARMKSVLSRRKVVALERQYRRLAEEQNTRLEEIVASRTAELQRAHTRLRLLDEIKGDFLQMIAHEIRTPLNGVLNVSELAFEILGPSEEQSELRELFAQSRDRLVRLLEDALLLNRLQDEGDQFEKEKVSFDLLWNDAWERSGLDPALASSPPNTTGLGSCSLLCNEQLVVTALSTILCVVHKLGHNDAFSQMSCQPLGDRFQLSITFLTRSVGQGDFASFFEVHSASRSWTEAEDLGLAPVVARRIFELYQGTLDLVPIDGQYVELRLTLPLEQDSESD